MTVTKYADGRVVRNSLRCDALDDLREEFPDMFIWPELTRTLVWANESDSENDDGSKAVAVLTVEME